MSIKRQIKLARLWKNRDRSALSQAAFIEHRTYPAIAKYHLNSIGVKMTTISRTCDVSQMGEYDILCVEKMNRLIAHFEKLTGVRA